MTTSAAHSLVIRVRLAGTQEIPALTAMIAQCDGVVTELKSLDADRSGLTVRVVCDLRDDSHFEALASELRGYFHDAILELSDRTLQSHLGDILETALRLPIETRDDLSIAYTPGVARISLRICAEPSLLRDLTIMGNSVAIVTDGSAVLGLGNVGPRAALPVMEGKAALFKRFAGIDAWPVCLDTQDTDEIVRTVAAIAPGFAGINLEDIVAPRCFEVERRLREILDIPVFHDDQHGTAIVVLAALYNALEVVGKKMGDVTATILGIGAAGVAITRLLLSEGIGDVVALNSRGILDPADISLDFDRRWIAENTNRDRRRGGLAEAIRGTDVFIGVSGPGLLSEEQLKLAAADPIVFALANPTPEIAPELARQYAAVVATGRSDEPNQINNVLAFPGVFRGLLDCRATSISEDVEVAAARSLAAIVEHDELAPDLAIPSPFNVSVVPAMARAAAQSLSADS